MWQLQPHGINMTYNTKVINLFGGAGIGKSTVAARVFSELKMLGKEVELVTEYAKEMVWEDRQPILNEQLYVFAKQYRRLNRLMGKVEYIITDSPITLGIVYTSDEYFKNLKPLIIEAHESFDNMNFLLNRSTAYNSNGRMQTEQGARVIDERIKKLLVDNQYRHTEINVDGNAHQTILIDILEKTNG